MTDPDLSLSDRLAERIRDLRTRAGMSQDALAAAAREHGAGGAFTATVVGFMESGRRKAGRRTRLFGLDEVLPLAAALEVSPLELLGESAQLFLGDKAQVEVVCPACAAGPGGLETLTREDLARLEPFSPLELTLVESAYRLAKAIDQVEDGRSLPPLMKELRATVQELGAGRRRTETPPEDDFGDLDEPE